MGAFRIASPGRDVGTPVELLILKIGDAVTFFLPGSLVHRFRESFFRRLFLSFVS
jgi:hypothetical protein